jgi:hypothetical protein
LGASLTVRDSVITSNTANISFGGGIFVATGASLSLITTVSNNTATVNGAAGGGIHSLGTLTVTNSTISGNTSSGTTNPKSGGAIVQNGASLTITGSTISDNSAAAAGSGGGIILRGAATATLTNTTISGNSAPGTPPTAGAIMHDSTGLVSIINSTINGNTTQTDGVLTQAGLVVNASGGFKLKNTILASNGPQNCSVVGTGTIVSISPNLDSGNTCGFSAAFGDLVSTNPVLGPLQLNGGLTQTHVPLPGSPVIDAGANAGCPTTDQRSVPRPLDVTHPGFTVCDLGAVEVEALGFITLSFALSTTIVHPGTPLQGTVTVANDGGARPLDVYVFFLAPPAAGPALGCPGGDAIAFLTTSGPTLACVSSGVQTFALFLRNVTLAADLTSLTAPFFSLTWPGPRPAAGWPGSP